MQEESHGREQQAEQAAVAERKRRAPLVFKVDG